jgi:hypothetical protein
MKLAVAARKYGWWLLVAVVCLWLLYVAWGSTSFQKCIAEKQSEQPQQASEKYTPKIFRVFVVNARIETNCFFRFSYDRRDAIAAIAAAFVALFTFTLWRATTGLRESTDKLWGASIRQICVAEQAAEASHKSASVAEKSLRVANRPVINISPLELRQPEQGQVSSHIHFGLMNGGNGAAVVNRVLATVQTTPVGGNVLTLAHKTQYYAAPSVGFVIEIGQSIDGGSIESPLLGVSELQQISAGQMRLEIIFEIAFKDIIENDYVLKYPFIFDHTQGIFICSSRLIPENAQKNK